MGIANGPMYYSYMIGDRFMIDWVELENKVGFKDTDNYWTDWFSSGYKDCKNGYLVKGVHVSKNEKVKILCAPVLDTLHVQPRTYDTPYYYFGRRSCGHNIGWAENKYDPTFYDDRYFSGMDVFKVQYGMLVPRCRKVERWFL